MSEEPLVCPSCALEHAADERFCTACGMPLVFSGVPTSSGPIDPRHERARKIKPQYAEGPLVRVAVGRHQAEAELIMGLLLEHGVPSMAKRSAGFDVPDMLFSGPRDILVPQTGEVIAREVLADVEAAHDADCEQDVSDGARRAVRARAGRPTRSLAVIVVAALGLVSLGPIIVWLSRVL